MHQLAGRTKDPKTLQITVRVNASDLLALYREAGRQHCTVGSVVRGLVRVHLCGEAPVKPRRRRGA